MNVSIITLGCKVNQSESMFLEGKLKNYGCSLVNLSERPDYCIINTCSVTSKSDYQSRQFIRRAVRAGSEVIVTGCYAQLNPEAIRNTDSKAIIVNNKEKYNIINLLLKESKTNTFAYSSRARPYLKIQDGCNSSCTYCVVPMARGRSRSISVSEIIDSVIEFENHGFNEIVLTGIHLGLYGYDLRPKTKLSELIKRILYKTKIKRLRMSSLEIREIDDEIIELLLEKRLCKHLHIPLQSGDIDILNKMNRHYTPDEYIFTFEKITKKIPNIAIGTDVIVGFPNETDKAFINTKEILEYLPFAYIHIFPFSLRPNTIASLMPLQIPFSKKKERCLALNTLNQKKKSIYRKLQKNKTLDLIIEEKHPDNTMTGTSSNYQKILIYANDYSLRNLVNVSIVGVAGDMLVGNPFDKA